MTKRKPAIVLGIDPGALRMGWGVIYRLDMETPIEWHLRASGYFGLKRDEGEGAQDYRARLLAHMVCEFGELLDELERYAGKESEDCEVVFETLPLGGGSANFRAGSSQGELAKAALTACQVLCIVRDIPWRQIAATTIKLKATGWGNATKVQVRDAVIRAIPELEPRKRELTKYADEADGIAVALVGAGYRVPKAKAKNPRRQAK